MLASADMLIACYREGNCMLSRPHMASSPYNLGHEAMLWLFKCAAADRQALLNRTAIRPERSAMRAARAGGVLLCDSVSAHANGHANPGRYNASPRVAILNGSHRPFLPCHLL